jgi:hypothetical protein
MARKIIGEARRIVVLHSTFVGKNIDALLPALTDAVTAGVQVYIHWGKKDDPEGIVANASELAANMARTRIDAKFRYNVHLGAKSTGSHAKAILADNPADGGYRVLLGSCNWLDSPFKSVEASVYLTDPGAVALVAGRLAMLIVPAIGPEHVVVRLLEIQAECASRPEPETPHSVMLIVDDDHYAAVRDAMNEVKPGGDVILGSHKFGHAGETSVLDPMREAARHGARVKLFYSKVLPNFGKDAASAKGTQLAEQAIELRQAGQEMHAKFIGWGDKLLITSFNFLSASVNGKQRNSELGLLLQGPDVIDTFGRALAGLDVFTKYQTPERSHRKKRRKRNRRPKTPELENGSPIT